VGVVAVPAIVFLVLLFRIPRSPRWSASRRQVDEALEVLGQMGAPDPDAELAEIQAALNSEHAVEHEPVFRWKYRFRSFWPSPSAPSTNWKASTPSSITSGASLPRPASASFPETCRRWPSGHESDLYAGGHVGD